MVDLIEIRYENYYIYVLIKILIKDFLVTYCNIPVYLISGLKN